MCTFTGHPILRGVFLLHFGWQQPRPYWWSVDYKEEGGTLFAYLTCGCNPVTGLFEHTKMASSSYTRQTTLHLVTTKFIWWCTAYIIINKRLKILTHITPVISVCCGRELPADEESFLLSQWSPDDNTVSVLRIKYCFAHVTIKCDIKS